MIKEKQCEMCGLRGPLVKAEIEGAVMAVCAECAKFGRVIREIIVREAMPQKTKKEAEAKGAWGAGQPKKTVQKEEIVETINPDFSELIRNKREKLGIKQKDLAKMLAEKESLIQKMEIGQFTPSIGMAKKIEKILKIKLVEEEKETPQSFEKSSSEEFTLGDFIRK